MGKDFYEVLGISRSATASEIKKAYHKLAMKYHPDRNKGDKAAEAKFKEINEAYEVLSDPQKKAAYDRYGSQAFEQGGFSQQGGGGQGFEGFDFSGGFGGVHFEDIINEVFGAGRRSGGARSQRPASQPGSDIRYDLSLSLEEAFSGTTTRISFRTFCPCEKCKGTGSANGKGSETCSVCQGRGAVRSQQGFFTVERTCPQCGGSGQVIKNPCLACSGLGRVLKEKNLDVTVPKGVDDGTRIRLAGEGECGIRGGAKGDLYVFISLKVHPLFKRLGKDLTCKMPISFATAALGKEVSVTVLDKTSVTLKIPEGTQTGHQFRIKGKGMPGLRGHSFGDLLVEVVVETPVKLSSRQKELLQELESGEHSAENNPLRKGFLAKIKEFFGDAKDK